MSIPPPTGPDRDDSGWRFEPRRGYPEGTEGGAVPLSDPLIPADLRGWFDRAVGVVRRSLIPLLAIQLGVAAVVGLISYLALAGLPTPTGDGAGLLGLPPAGGAAGPAAQPDPFGDPTALVGLLIMLCVTALGQCASVYVALKDAAGRPTSAEQALHFAIRRAPALIGWEFVAGLLMLCGLAMLFAPGLYLAVVFGAALVGVVVVERGTLVRCLQLVNARLWPTVGRMALVGVAVGIYGFLADFAVGALSSPGTFNAAMLQALISVPLGVAAVGVLLVTYGELRFHADTRVVTATLADELDR